MQGVGQQTMGLVLDGLLVRDLQVAPGSTHSHFLQPLPARSRKLTGYATKFRRRLLRLLDYSEAHRRWGWLTLSSRQLQGSRQVRTSPTGLMGSVSMSLWGW